jgi:type IX secretion system PorP/SprF family membrane protein
MLKMKGISRFIFCLLFCLLFVFSYGQDNLQNLFQPVFNNPSYNAFNDCYSVNMVVRNQWGNSVVGSPDLYGLNLFVPTERILGFSAQLMDEEQGWSSRHTVMGFLSHYVRFSETQFLGFGYGVGIDNFSYDIEGILEDNPEVNIDDYEDLENETNARVAVGLTYNAPHFFAGVSFNTTLNDEYSKYNFARGFDGFTGYFFNLKNGIVLKPNLEVKYYRYRESFYYESESKTDWIDPIVNLGINALLYNRIWLGVSQRFNYAQTYTVAFYISKLLKVAYTFERGIGSGVNQFDSHRFGLSWNFNRRKNNIEDSESDKMDEEKFISAERNLMYK